MVYQIRDKDGCFIGDPLVTLEDCEKKIAYESDMDHGKLFYVTNAETGRVVDTYKICEHFECIDNISCENCLGYPNCPLHERLKAKVMTETEEFEKIELTEALLEYLKESAEHSMDFNALWLERLGLVGMNSAEQKYDERVATAKGRRYLAWLEQRHG